MLKQHAVAILTGSQAIGYDIGDYILDASTAIAITLPAQSLGVWYRFINAGTVAATVAGISINPGDLAFFCSDGAEWRYSISTGSQSISGYLTTDKIDNSEYGAGWDGDNSHAPTKEAVYHKVETLHSVPSGGTDKQVLSKNSASDYDVLWRDETHDLLIRLDILVNGGDGLITAALAEM